MDSFDQFWNDLSNYAHNGFAHVNVVQGLIIAIIAAWMMYRWSSVIIVAAGATLVHAIVDVMLPVLANNAPFQLPPVVDGDYWRYLLTLYVGYLIVITVFYVIKRMLIDVRHSVA